MCYGRLWRMCMDCCDGCVNVAVEFCLWMVVTDALCAVVVDVLRGDSGD